MSIKLKKTELQTVRDNIVISWFKNILFKATKEKFDSNEIEEYIKMSVDDYIGNNLSLSTEDTIKWLKYRIINFASTALSYNKTQLKSKNLFLKKAKTYRNKSLDLEKKGI